MILSPEQFIPAEVARHYESVQASRHHAAAALPAVARGRRPRRGLLLRVVSVAVGRTAHV